jgi:hypothetical protein
MKDTMWGIAEFYEETGNIYESVQHFSNNLIEIQTHLNGIASSWKAAGDDLQFRVNAPIYTPVMIGFFASFFVLLVVALIIMTYRKR